MFERMSRDDGKTSNRRSTVRRFATRDDDDDRGGAERMGAARPPVRSPGNDARRQR